MPIGTTPPIGVGMTPALAANPNGAAAGTAMLPPTVDYSTIRETRALPVSWMSTHGVSIKSAGDYERDCKRRGIQADPAEIARLIDGPMVHLEETILAGGLRYVGIFSEDGEQIFNDSMYGGLISCGCGAIHDSECVTMADAIRGTDLGDGFELQMTVSGNSKGYGRTSSYVDKNYTVDGKDVEVRYSIDPQSENEAGHLSFGFKTVQTGPHTQTVRYITEEHPDGELREVTETITKKIVEVKINTQYTNATGGKNHPNCVSSISVALNLGNRFNTQWDQVEFKFGIDGKLEEIVGISQSDNENPEWSSPELLGAIQKGSNGWFRYSANDPEAKVISEALLGVDITQMRHNTRDTLNALMQLAIKEEDIDLGAVLNFIP